MDDPTRALSARTTPVKPAAGESPRVGPLIPWWATILVIAVLLSIFLTVSWVVYEEPPDSEEGLSEEDFEIHLQVVERNGTLVRLTFTSMTTGMELPFHNSTWEIIHENESTLFEPNRFSCFGPGYECWPGWSADGGYQLRWSHHLTEASNNHLYVWGFEPDSYYGLRYVHEPTGTVLGGLWFWTPSS